MRTYNQLNEAEKWICDSVTATWWFPSGGVPDTDTVDIFVRYQDSIRALHTYQGAGDVSTAAITEAIVSRYNFLVSLSDD
jgi:hypothetical protein